MSDWHLILCKTLQNSGMQNNILKIAFSWRSNVRKRNPSHGVASTSYKTMTSRDENLKQEQSIHDSGRMLCPFQIGQFWDQLHQPCEMIMAQKDKGGVVWAHPSLPQSDTTVVKFFGDSVPADRRSGREYEEKCFPSDPVAMTCYLCRILLHMQFPDFPHGQPRLALAPSSHLPTICFCWLLSKDMPYNFPLLLGALLFHTYILVPISFYVE